MSNPTGPSRTKREPVPEPDRYMDSSEQRRTHRLTITAPLASCVLAATLYMLTLPWLPKVWVSHVDGQGTLTYAPHWPLALVSLLAAALAFVISRLLVREHTQAGHWHDLEKGIVVAVLSAGYGFLVALLATVAASVGRAPEELGTGLIGLGLLGFVLGLIGAIAVHTPALPRARVDRWTPHY